ncbi:hypothetical protein ACFLW8_06195, partial [Chloroflexota bacterium]
AKKEAEISAREQALREAEKQAKQEAEVAAKQQAKRETEKREVEETQEVAAGTSSMIYQGDVQLVVSSPVGLEQVRELKESLEQVEDLKILWTGGSVENGTIIAVSLENPIPLISILNKIPTVEKVEMRGKSILVMLKAPLGS